MDKKLKANPLKSLSFLKLTGITKFIMADIFQSHIKLLLVNRKEPFYKLTGNSSINNFEIIAYETEEYSGDINEIEQILKKFISKHEADDAYLILGINEYRAKTLSVSNEEEDIHLWLLENSDKFIPSGKPIADFNFSYEQYREDEDNLYFLVAISRSDYISKLIKVCAKTGLSILSISLFPLSCHSLNCSKDVNSVFVDIGESTLKYSFSDTDQNLFIGEIYHEIFSNPPTSENKINIKNLQSCIKQLHDTIKLDSNGSGLNDLHLYLSTDSEYFSEIKNCISKEVKPEFINKNYDEVNPVHLSFLFTLDNLISNFDKKVNLLDSELLGKERFELEKKIGTRTTLASGAILISLLLITFVLESFISSKIKDGQENLLEVNAKASVIEKLEDENNKLKANLSLLGKLKNSRVTYSNLLSTLSEIVTAKSSFTNVILKEEKKDLINLKLNGLAYNQQEVAEIMKRMEEHKNFNNISLLFSNAVQTKNVKTNIRIRQKELINFNLSAEYNAN